MLTSTLPSIHQLQAVIGLVGLLKDARPSPTPMEVPLRKCIGKSV